MKSTRLRTILVGVLGAAAFALALNAGTIRAARDGRLSFTTVAPSVDDQYYSALIADGAQGNWNLGHASLKEHRDGVASSTYAPLLQSALMRFAGLGIVPALMLGDVLFPFLIAFLLFLGLARGLGSPLLAAATALLLMADTNVGWLRAVTPQTTFIVVAAYLAVLLCMGRSRFPLMLRGALLGLMLFTHVLHASFFAIVEACDALWRFLRRPGERKEHLMNLAWIAVPFLILLAVKAGLLLFADDAIARADTFRRLGMIESRLPAAPSLQLPVLGAAILLWRLRGRFTPALRSVADATLLVLVAGLVGLNQSVLHGRDLIFGLYYAPILRMALWLTIMLMFLVISRRVLRTSLACMVIGVTLIVTSVRSLRAEESAVRSAPPVDTLAVASWFAGQPKGQVVLAPYEIGNLLPPLAGQYVVFNKYALYQNVRDEELAERYILQQTVFPTSAEERGEGYNSVFGLYAGNTTARERTFCRIRRMILRSADACDLPVRSGVYHQDLLAGLDRALAEPPSDAQLSTLLETFNVDWIVVPGEIPQALRSICRREQAMGVYTVYRCS